MPATISARPVVSPVKELTRRIPHLGLELFKWFNAQKGFGFIQPEGGAPTCSYTFRQSSAPGWGRCERVKRFSYEVQADAKRRKILGGKSEGRLMQVFVHDNDINAALRVLKKKMQRKGTFREMKLRRAYEKPSERRVRERAEAVRRQREGY